MSGLEKLPGADSMDVEKQLWYHGFRPRRDIERLLEQTGDFLVRATGSTNRVDLVLSVRSESKGVLSLTIVFIEGKWQLGIIKSAPKNKKLFRFDTIPKLIQYYTQNKISSHLQLKRPINRPEWLIKHEKVVYDDKKDLLGSGNFCNVYKGTLARSNDEVQTVAVKICHQEQSGKSEGEKAARENMLLEARTMAHFAHNYVIQLFGVACDHPPVLIVMEFCPGGSLEKHLSNQKGKIEIGELLCYSMEAARGMRYLHLSNCVHRDLAARNCLISAQGYIKISDFGLSKLLGDKKDDDQADEVSGTSQLPVRWMAPESLRRPVKYSKSSDVWSYGVLIYEIFNDGIKPWPDDPTKKVATNIRKCKMPAMPDKTPQEIKDLMDKVWVLDPTKRLSMKEICVKIWKLFKKYKPPPVKSFTVNTIPGVCRPLEIRENKAGDEAEDQTDTNRESIENEGQGTKSATTEEKKDDETEPATK